MRIAIGPWKYINSGQPAAKDSLLIKEHPKIKNAVEKKMKEKELLVKPKTCNKQKSSKTKKKTKELKEDIKEKKLSRTDKILNIRFIKRIREKERMTKQEKIAKPNFFSK